MAGLPQLAPTAVIDEQNATISVLETESGRLMITNKVGHSILLLCDGTRTVDEVITALSSQFPDAPKDAIRSDVEEFLTGAREKGVIIE